MTRFPREEIPVWSHVEQRKISLAHILELHALRHSDAGTEVRTLGPVRGDGPEDVVLLADVVQGRVSEVQPAACSCDLVGTCTPQAKGAKMLASQIQRAGRKSLPTTPCTLTPDDFKTRRSPGTRRQTVQEPN